MSKYEPLQRHLDNLPSSRVPMTFRDIETILGFSLPPSARRYRSWWSNNPTNSVITRAWLDAGYRTEQVDLERRRLVFRRKPPAGAGTTVPKIGGHPLVGCMKGTVTMAPGFDPTMPADPEWGARAYGEAR